MNDQNAPIDARSCAFFFDVDGTLALIQPSPKLVAVLPKARVALERMQHVGLAVALISGRPLAQIDALVAPLRFPAAGIHGAERRTANGDLQRLALQSQIFREIGQALGDACAAHAGLRLENKGIAFALHFRQAPELEDTARELAESFVRHYEEVLALQPGKCVYELKPRYASKGEAIRAFMREAPFHGKRPVFVGDDVTDEAGFDVVNQMGGLSIKVGEGPTSARKRLASVEAVGDWLINLLDEVSDPQENNNDTEEYAP